MVYTAVITFGSSAVQLTAANVGYPANQYCRRVLIEPLRANTHASYVGLSNVTRDGSGTGVVQELSIPAAGVALDRFLDAAGGSAHNIDPSAYYVHGTASEGCTVTVWTI